jgi:hypothetical protein
MHKFPYETTFFSATEMKMIRRIRKEIEREKREREERERERERGGARAYLSVELDVGSAEADEAGEHRLVEARVLLEGHVLHDGRQLIVIANQHHPLQP